MFYVSVCVCVCTFIKYTYPTTQSLHFLQIDNEPSNLAQLVFHQDMVDNIREEAQASSCKEADKMVKSRLAKNPPTQYKVDDEVVIRLPRPDARLRRGGYGIKNTTCERGKVVQCRPEQHQYKVQTQEDVRWMNVRDITSVTAEIEKARKKRQETETEQGKLYLIYSVISI